ncbi:hypothetical protein DPMN_029058 [Dreissena polymorpha]|uniref:Uncharacterized protein n=1 Tax=Dreissena polymorpha TaxID=45954 RepID=A0A9D4RFW8_DREPO|nr:hypothetical protein DPMN_029058 [Dreissena polymorpha]
MAAPTTDSPYGGHACNEGYGDEEACSEPLSSNALVRKKDTSSRTSGYKYREERACKGCGGDEEACSEPVSSNALLEKDTSSRTSGVKYREERASVRFHALLEKDTSSRTSGYKYREERASVRGNEGGGDEEACSEPLSSNALLEKDKSSRTSGYKYREERASVRDPESSDTDHDVPVRQPHAKPGPSTTVTMSGHPKRLQKLGEDQNSNLIFGMHVYLVELHILSGTYKHFPPTMWIKMFGLMILGRMCGQGGLHYIMMQLCIQQHVNLS